MTPAILTLWLAITGPLDAAYCDAVARASDIAGAGSLLLDRQLLGDSPFGRLLVLDELQGALGFPAEMEAEFTAARLRIIWGEGWTTEHRQVPQKMAVRLCRDSRIGGRCMYPEAILFDCLGLLGLNAAKRYRRHSQKSVAW